MEIPAIDENYDQRRYEVKFNQPEVADHGTSESLKILLNGATPPIAECNLRWLITAWAFNIVYSVWLTGHGCFLVDFC